MTGDDRDLLTGQFEEHRPRLRAMASRMLGSASDADDAVQEAWLRVSRAGTDDVHNVGGWLTTVVSRVCLNVLRSRGTHPETALDPHVPDPVVRPEGAAEPEDEAVLADSVGLALLVVLDQLPPAERLAFVLHDLFGVPFDEIASVVDRSPAATRQLASRARRRVRGGPSSPDVDLARQREVVDAFFAASRGGDLAALVAVLDPDVVLRADLGPDDAVVVRGAEAVARRAAMFAATDRVVTPAVVNGAAGVVVTVGDEPVSVMGFTVAGGRIIAIEALGDAERLRRLFGGSAS